MPPDSFESGLFVLVDSTGREPGQAKAGYHHEGDILPFDILNKAWYTRLSSINLANVFVKSFFIDFPIFFWKKGALN